MKERRKASSFIEFWGALRGLDRGPRPCRQERLDTPRPGFYRRSRPGRPEREDLQVVRSSN